MFSICHEILFLVYEDKNKYTAYLGLDYESYNFISCIYSIENSMFCSECCIRSKLLNIQYMRSVFTKHGHDYVKFEIINKNEMIELKNTLIALTSMNKGQNMLKEEFIRNSKTILITNFKVNFQRSYSICQKIFHSSQNNIFSSSSRDFFIDRESKFYDCKLTNDINLNFKGKPYTIEELNSLQDNKSMLYTFNNIDEFNEMSTDTKSKNKRECKETDNTKNIQEHFESTYLMKFFLLFISILTIGIGMFLTFFKLF